MNCQDAHERLQQSLDGIPIESPEWLEHLRDCAECRALAAAGRRLQEGLRLLSAPLPPPDLATRIVEAVLCDRRRAKRRARQRWAVTLALAAALFIAVLLRLDWRTPTPDADVQPREPVAAKETDKTNKPAPPAPTTAPTLRESASELGAVFASLTNQTAEETVGQTRRWVSNVSGPELPKVDLTTMEPPTQPLRAAGEGVSEGLEPVTTSARRAVGLFLRELPMETDSNGL
jgi:hypothetical protein